MSINDATPADWDRVRDTGHPTFEEYMKRLDSKYVYDSTEDYGNEVTSDAGDFADCWDEEEDVVNNPSHYNTGNIECIEAIEESMTPEAYRGYLKGNCMKYLWRYDYKGKPVEDLEKAQWYLAKLLNVVVFEEEKSVDFNDLCAVRAILDAAEVSPKRRGEWQMWGKSDG